MSTNRVLTPQHGLNQHKTDCTGMTVGVVMTMNDLIQGLLNGGATRMPQKGNRGFHGAP